MSPYDESLGFPPIYYLPFYELYRSVFFPLIMIIHNLPISPNLHPAPINQIHFSQSLFKG